jgi:hypothetical protein
MRRVAGGCHQEPVADQEFLQQRPDAFIVIDDQQMCVHLAHVPLSLSLA